MPGNISHADINEHEKISPLLGICCGISECSSLSSSPTKHESSQKSLLKQSQSVQRESPQRPSD